MGDLTNWIGIVLQTAAILAAVGGFVFKLHINLKLLMQSHEQSKTTITNVETELKQLGQVMLDLARQDQKIVNLETRVQELSKRLYDFSKRPEPLG